jgi:hypothetical protein
MLEKARVTTRLAVLADMVKRLEARGLLRKKEVSVGVGGLGRRTKEDVRADLVAALVRLQQAAPR